MSESLPTRSDPRLKALLALAMTSEADGLSRRTQLCDVATAYAAAGDLAQASAALQELLRLLKGLVKGEAESASLGNEALDAAQRAEGMGLPELSRDFCEVGLKALENHPGDLLVGLLWYQFGNAAMELGDRRDALEGFREAVSSTQDNPDVGNRLVTLVSLVAAEERWGDQAAAVKGLEQATELLADADGQTFPDREELVVCAHRLGRSGERLQRHELARAAYGTILGLLEDEPTHPLLGVTWHDLGDCYRAEGDVVKASEGYLTALRLKRQVGPAFSRLITLTVLLRYELDNGRFDQAIDRLVEGEETARAAVTEGVDPTEFGRVLSDLTALADRAGRPEKADALRRVTPPGGPGLAEETHL